MTGVCEGQVDSWNSRGAVLPLTRSAHSPGVLHDKLVQLVTASTQLVTQNCLPEITYRG